MASPLCLLIHSLLQNHQNWTNWPLFPLGPKLIWEGVFTPLALTYLFSVLCPVLPLSSVP